MSITRRYAGIIHYLRTHWPTYLLIYGGGTLLGMVITWISIIQGWFSFVVLVAAGLIVLLYFFAVSLWSAHILYDGDIIIDRFFDLGEFTPDENLVYVDLRLRSPAVAMSHRLTTGKVIVVDVYNPQLAPNRGLARAVQLAERPVEDPRLSWKGGSIGLLPLPDASVPLVVMSMVAGAFWQQGDRLCLLREISRVLEPGGRLLMAERVRTPTNWLVLGPYAIRLPSLEYWHRLLAEAEMEPIVESSIRDLLCIIRADKEIKRTDSVFSQ